LSKLQDIITYNHLFDPTIHVLKKNMSGIKIKTRRLIPLKKRLSGIFLHVPGYANLILIVEFIANSISVRIAKIVRTRRIFNGISLLLFQYTPVYYKHRLHDGFPSSTYI